MTRLQGSAHHFSGHSPTGVNRASLHSSKLPPGTPDIIVKNTVVVNDPARILSWNRDERQRNFNLLVRRYKSQLLHGCQEPNCTTPTCLSFRRRVTEAPFRNFTDLSARTLACYLASQDDPEKGLCRNLPAASPDSLAEGDTSWRTTRLPPLSAQENSGLFGYARHDRRRRAAKGAGSDTRKLRRPSNESLRPENNGLSNLPEVIESSEPQISHNASPQEAPRPKALKDPKSITQNLFDTLSVRMVEWLPLRKVASAYGSRSFGGEEEAPLRRSSSGESSEYNGNNIQTRRETLPKVRRATLTNDRPPSKTHNISSIPLNAPSPTLEVKVPGQPVKRLSLGELDHWKQPLRSISDDAPKNEKKPARKRATNNTATTTSLPLPSPPPLKHRRQKRRHKEPTDNQCNNEERHQQHDPVNRPKNSPDLHYLGPKGPRSRSEPISPAGSPSHNGDLGRFQLNVEPEPQVESLSVLSKDIVDSLEKMMFETEEDEDVWKNEMMRLESQGYTEPLNCEFATPRQRQLFPFVAQSLFFILSNPEQLLRSFRSTSGNPKCEGDITTISYIDVQNLDGVFRKLYRICPWETTLNSLWICLEKLFVPPKEFSTSTKNQRRFIWRSRSNSFALRGSEYCKDEPSSQNHISDSDAAYIAVVALFALASSIPCLDSQTWQAIRRMRSAGTVLPDFEVRKSSEMTARLLTETADKFEHDLALRLVSRLARVVAARLAFHEISKLKTSYIHDVGRPNKPSPLDLIIRCIQPCIAATSSSSQPLFDIQETDRRTTMPMIAVEWLKSLLLKEWDGKPELLKSGAAGGALQLLSSLYQHRAKLGLIPEDFYISFLSERLDPMEMPVEWLGFVSNNRTIHLLSCSFLFPPSSLVIYFRALNYSAMSKSYETAMTTSRHVTQTAFSSSIAIDDDIGLLARLKTSISTYLVLVVRRDDALTDALNQLWRREKRELMRPLRVQMGMDEGEEGIDHGGVQQEFFRVVMAEALESAYGMFTLDSRSHISWFQPCSFEPLYKFELLGLLMSLAVYNGLTLPVNFPVALYMKLLDWKVKNLDHIRNGWGELAKGLGELLSWADGDVGDIFMRTYEFSFDAFGKVVTVDMTTTGRNDPWPLAERNVTWNKTKLRSFASSSESGDTENFDSPDYGTSMLQSMPGDNRLNRRDGHLSGILKGSSSKPRERRVPSPPEHEAPLVTNANREQFVKDYIFWLTDKSVRPQYEAFARGFYTCLDRTALSIFTPDSLKTVVEGIQEIDIEELEKHARYDGFEPQDQLMKDFWEVVKSYSPTKRSQLLAFVTASDRVPVNGISSIVFVIMKNGSGDDGFHNLSHENHIIPDPLLTPHGETQCGTLRVNFPFHSDVELIVASPLRRTIYTALLAFEAPLKEKGLKVIALPELQETSDVPCDIGSDLEVLEKEVNEKNLPVDLSLLMEGWNDKTSARWSADEKAISARAREARRWLKSRPEKEIVIVSHGGFLHYFTEDWQDSTFYTVTKKKPSPSNYTNLRPSPVWPGTGWANTEFRTYEFTEEIHEDDLYGQKIDGDNASIIEIIDSRRRRGKAEPPAPRELQKKFFVLAMMVWKNQLIQNAAAEQEEEEIKQTQHIQMDLN
ncbi:hypothetical protein PRK78_003577 [Emydomyces testavorans]|uniref:HECT-type E3 ubiquitin transferase n=1 Tax=Emydomyces testavorans TaxID=2070801 RepID=A0AAF0DGG9_9EURO|nr:hypothetical protein PRK78_003577 [Emydomyces testavorans]